MLFVSVVLSYLGDRCCRMLGFVLFLVYRYRLVVVIGCMVVVSISRCSGGWFVDCVFDLGLLIVSVLCGMYDGVCSFHLFAGSFLVASVVVCFVGGGVGGSSFCVLSLCWCDISC